MDAGDSIELQMEEVLSKIDRLLEEGNSSRRDLVKVTILMTDINNYSVINRIYGEWLEDIIPPSRAAYEVPNLPMGAKVEIVCEAFRGLE